MNIRPKNPMKKILFISMLMAIQSSIVFASPLMLQPKTLENNYVVTGQPFSFQLTAVNAILPYTFSVYSNNFPESLSLDAQKGLISGSLDQVTSLNFGISIVDARSMASRTYTIHAIKSIESALKSSILYGTVGSFFYESLHIIGGEGKLTVSIMNDPLPSWLQLNYNMILSGTPSEAGFSDLHIRVADERQNQLDLNLTIRIFDKLTLTTQKLYDGCVAKPYSMPISVNGGSGDYTLTVYNLPDGLEVDQENHAITGSPETAIEKIVRIEVQDSLNNKVGRNLKLTISNELTVAPLPQGHVNENYNHFLLFSGGKSDYTCSVNGEIDGVSFNSETCCFDGIPEYASNYNLEITITDSAYPVPQIIHEDMHVRIHEAMFINTPPVLPDAFATKAINPLQIAIVGAKAPVTANISSGGLPEGIQLNTDQIQLCGIPKSSGLYKFTIDITDGEQFAAKTFYWHIQAPLMIESQYIPPMIFQHPYSHTFKISGGVYPLTCYMTNPLPDGIEWHPQKCQLYGQLQEDVSSFYINFRVEDSAHQVDQNQFEINTFNPENMSFTPNTVSPALTYRTYRQLFTSQNQNVTAHWDIISASIPGLHFRPAQSSLLLFGIPDCPGEYAFTIKLSDEKNQLNSVKQSYTLTVVSPLSMNTKQLDSVVKDRPYQEVLSVAGGEQPYRFWIESGSLVSGIQFDEKTSQFSGTLTDTQAHSTNLTICVEESGYFTQHVCREFSMLAISDTDLNIEVEQMGTARQYSPITVVFSGSGGARPYHWELEDLPDGLHSKIHENNLILSGYPTVCNPASRFLMRPRLIDQQSYVTSRAYGLDIDCTCDYTLSGNLSLLPNIAVGLYRDELQVAQTTTDPKGDYTFTHLGCQSYYVKPVSQQFLFTPETSTIITRENRSDIHFNTRFIHDIPKEKFQAKALIIISDNASNLTGIHNEIETALTKKDFQKDLHYQWVDQYTDTPLTQIETAITQWASDASLLWIYVGGVMDAQTIPIGSQQLSIQSLSLWLNNYGENPGSDLVFIAEGSSARSFINNLNTESLRQTITIAAGWPDPITNKWSFFSGIFWDHLRTDTLGEAYIEARDYFLNGDGVVLDIDHDNEESLAEIAIASQITLKADRIDMPQIVDHSKTQGLRSSDRVQLWMDITPGTYDIETAFAIVHSAPLSGNGLYDISSDHKRAPFEYNAQKNRYEAIIQFPEKQDYIVVFWAQDSDGNFANPEFINIYRDEIYKAIIVSGKQADGEIDFLQNAVQLNADFAYDTLIHAGFLEEEIIYLTAYEQSSRLCQKLTTASDLERVMTQTAQESDRLLIYMIDHGNEDKFFINNHDQYVTGQTFSRWLQAIADEIPKGLLLIYDACNSGEFMTHVSTNNISPFLRITSTSPDEDAVFYNDGTLSFSFQFWTNIYTNKFSISEAFDNAKVFLTLFTNIDQTPRRDLNGNNNWDEDYEDTHDFYIFKHEKEVHFPARIQSRLLEDRAVLDLSCQLSESIDQDISEIFTIIKPPEPISTFTYQASAMKLSMQRQDNQYFATYPNALANGDYDIRYFARYTDGSQKLVHTEIVTQEAAGKKDCFEPDDKLAMAIPLDHALYRNFHTHTDKDIMYFYAQANHTYTITVLQAPPMSLSLTGLALESEVNRSMNQDITETVWTCPHNGLYYLTAELASESNAVSFNYQIEIQYPNGKDAYENDDTYEQARPVDVNFRSVRFHTFHDNDTADWVKFYGVKGKVYSIIGETYYSNKHLTITIYNSAMEEYKISKRRIQQYYQSKPMICQNDGIYYVKYSPIELEKHSFFSYQLQIIVAHGEPIAGSVYGIIYDSPLTANPISDVGVYMIGSSNTVLTVDGNYLVTCHESGYGKQLFAYQNSYISKILRVDCLPFVEAQKYHFYMNSLQDIIQLLQIQAGMQPMYELNTEKQDPPGLPHILERMKSLAKTHQ